MRATYHSFEEVADALGMKVRKRAPKGEEEIKCPECGTPMRRIAGTNVLMCDMNTLSEERLKGGTEVQVFTPCGGRVLAAMR